MKLNLVAIGSLAAVLCAAPGAPAFAQTGNSMGSAAPSSPSTQDMFPNTPGVKRGLRALNNSGQVGEATLHAAGEDRTEVTLEIKGQPPQRPQRAGILRDPSGACSNPPTGAFAFNLSDVVDGRSHSTVPISTDRLLSGNYFIIVYSSDDPSHYFSCGQLFR